MLTRRTFLAAANARVNAQGDGPLVSADTSLVDAIHRQAMDGGGTYRSLITAIVLSDLVRTTKTEP